MKSSITCKHNNIEDTRQKENLKLLINPKNIVENKVD